MMRINAKGFDTTFRESTLMRAHNLMQFVTIGIISVVSLLLPLAPLHAQTQAAMNAQARAEFAQVDAELNKTYQSVLAKLPTVESKQKLREAQRAWLVSRDAEAARAGKEADGGSMAPTLHYETMTHLTRERIKELNNMLDHATQNGPKLPASSTTTSPSSTPESTSKQAQSLSETGRSSSSSAGSISPDKKWEYVGENAPKLVKADTKEAVLEFSCGLGGTDFSAPVWAPDSKRFAISCGGGKGNETSVYQLRDDQWVSPEEALGNGDQLFERAGKLVEAQAKKRGLPKKTFLHMQWWTVEPKEWLDASTLVVYASMAERVHRQNGEDVGLGFGTDLLVTLKFDDSGNWKIVNTHRMSEKEVKEHQ
jgi:uncharacterized protein YecT (DUF1311 family)